MPGDKSPLQTEFEFTLPKGYLDAEGHLHRQGVMRLSTAMDEIAPMRDTRVRNNQAYLSVAILARVVTRLGDLPQVDADVIERLFTADLTYLQDLYRRINGDGSNRLPVECPECGHVFEMELPSQGGS